ncbi:hypothetical protein ACFLYU_00720 [Candidatus Dependentiae bacterium]
MKKIKNGVKIGLCLIICCAACAVCSVGQDRVEVSFDRLFPQTPFTHVLKSCVSVLQDFDDVRQTKGQDPQGGDVQGQEVLTDLVVGKLFGIKMSIAKIKCQRPVYHKEDIVYLRELCDEILYEYKVTCSSFMHKPKSGYVELLIDQIKCKLDTL